MISHPYVRFFVSDWLGGTRGLKTGEVGIYITLIALMYDKEAPLPEDHERLARQCGCTSKQFVQALEMLIGEGEIGRWCGDRDHTTVMYGERKHKQRLEEGSGPLSRS